MSYWIHHYIKPADDFNLVEKLKADGYLTSPGTIWSSIRENYITYDNVIDMSKIIPKQVEHWKQEYKDSVTEQEPFDEREYDSIGKWPVHIFDVHGRENVKELEFDLNYGSHTEFLFGMSKLYPDERFIIMSVTETGRVLEDSMIQNGGYVTKNGQKYEAAFLVKKSSIKFENGMAYARVPLKNEGSESRSFFVTIKAPEDLVCEADDLMLTEKDSYDDYFAFLFDENHPAILMQRYVDVEGNLLSKTPFIIYDYKGEERSMPFIKFERMNHNAKKAYAIEKNMIKMDIDPRDTEIIIKHQANFDEELLKLKIKVSEETSENGELTVIFGRSNFKDGYGDHFFTSHPENEKYSFVNDKDYEKNVSIRVNGHYETVRKKISEIRDLYQTMIQERRNGLQSEESIEMEEDQERE